ncbi:MAG: hypothetical protein WDM92_10100 [Caulobacteraceae bacterium]
MPAPAARILGRARRLAAAAGLVLLLAPAGVSAQTAPQQPQQPVPTLRGPQGADASAANAAVPPPDVAAADPSRLPPNLSPMLTPDLSGPARIGGWSAPGGGGAQCREGCAEDLYLCRSGHDPEDCDPAWSQCVAACPENSSDF